MEVYQFKDLVNFKQTTMVLGSFEVFHLGHWQLLKKAKSLNQPIGIMVFDDYTLLNKRRKHQLTTLKVNLENLSTLGIDFAVVCTFNDQFKNMEANTFIDTLKKTCNLKNIVCGEDFVLGKDREWNIKQLKNYFANTFSVPLFRIGQSKLSTSNLHLDLELGLIGEINNVLTNKFRIKMRYRLDHFQISEKQALPHPGVYYGILTNAKNKHPVLIKVSPKYEVSYMAINPIELDIYHLVDLEFWDKKRVITNNRENVIAPLEKRQLALYFQNLEKAKTKKNQK